MLADRFRDSVNLLPRADEEAYGEVLQWLFFANSTLDAASDALPSDAEPQPFAPLVDVLSFLNSALANRNCIAAERFTVADIAIANNLKYVREHLDAHEHVKRYFTEHTSRPAYRRILAQPEYTRSY